MAESLPAFVKKFTTDAPRTLASSQRGLVRAAAEAAEGAMKASAEAARTKGITTRTTFFSHSDTGEAVNVKYGPNPGWVRIMNDPTQAHFIAPSGRGRGGSLRRQNLQAGVGKGRRSARAGKALLGLLSGGGAGLGGNGAINIKGVGPKAYAFHPGTKGKHFALRGIKAGEPLATRAYQQGALGVLGRVF